MNRLLWKRPSLIRLSLCSLVVVAILNLLVDVGFSVHRWYSLTGREEQQQLLIDVILLRTKQADIEAAKRILTLKKPEKEKKHGKYLFESQSESLVECPAQPPSLVGRQRVWFDAPSLEKIKELYPHLKSGGHGQPKECRARQKVAIIVPARNREKHLRVLLHNLHNNLKKQQLDYVIFVIEPLKEQTFNRAKLLNIGYVEAKKLYDWECFIFHDVDLLPEDDRNLYSCSINPRHMAAHIDKNQYKLPYKEYFGGVNAMSSVHMEAMNGFSNLYWGWGGEDDDLYERVKLAGLDISRLQTDIGDYKMIKHEGNESGNKVNACRHTLLGNSRKRWREDGLNNLEYEVQKMELLPLYTHILVDQKPEKTESKC